MRETDLLQLDSVEIYKLVLQGKQIKRFPCGFWQKPDALENAKKCTKFMIECILNLSDNDIKEKLEVKTFQKNKLLGMLYTCYNNSPYYAINLTYPDKFKPWELRRVPMNYWNEETCKETIKWLMVHLLSIA